MRADNGDLPRVAVVPWTLLLLIALLTACGSSQSGPSASADLETPTAQTSATPIVTTDPGDPTLLPVPADVAFLQAPIAIQNEWRTYYATGAITVVPNSTVPFTRPATPRVVDATNGAVSSTTAQQWGDALMRENAWENWAITADQTGLFDNGVISSSQVEGGLVLPAGATGLSDCRRALSQFLAPCRHPLHRRRAFFMTPTHLRSSSRSVRAGRSTPFSPVPLPSRSLIRTLR